MSIFSSFEGWFAKVFKNAPKWNAIALGVLNTAAPVAEEVLLLVDPSAEAAAAPVITEVQADLGTMSKLLKDGNTSGVVGLADSIKANLATLITAGHIKNPESVAKAQGLVTIIVNELDAIVGKIPQAS